MRIETLAVQSVYTVSSSSSTTAITVMIKVYLCTYSISRRAPYFLVF